MRTRHHPWIAYGLLALIAFSVSGSVLATPLIFLDNYIGENDHNLGDVIGDPNLFDISSAAVTLTGTQLQIDIYTDFAVKGLGTYPSYTIPGANGSRPGIGAGDLFLSDLENGATWTQVLSLDNRWSTNGGSASLYSLPDPQETETTCRRSRNGRCKKWETKNLYDSAILTPVDFLSGGTYRDGQAVAVDRTVTGVSMPDALGSWTPMTQNGVNFIRFMIETAETNLLDADKITVHWGPTCANDVIEFAFDPVNLFPAMNPGTIPPVNTGTVPEPLTLALLLPGLIWLRIRKAP
jgi:hypothetical protein